MTLIDHTVPVAALDNQLHVSIFENSPDCVKILDLDGSLRAMNRNGQCSMEIDDFNAVCGAMWPSLWPEATRADVQAAMSAARQGSIGQFEAFCPTYKGTPRWWDVVVSPLLGSDGSLQGLVSISRDVTQAKQADERERNLATKLRFALDVAGHGEWDLDADSGNVSYNERFKQCFGIRDASVHCAVEHLLTLVHDDDREPLRLVLLSTISNSDEFRLEFRVVWPDAGVHWVSMLGSRYDKAGANSHWTGLISDITERARDTEALKEDNRQKDASVSVLESRVSTRTADRDRMWRLSTDIMLVASFKGDIVAVNPAWSAILGHDEAGSLGANFLALVHPDDQAATLLEMEKLAHGQKSIGLQNRYRHADGAYRDMSWTAVPDIGLLHAVGRDITDEKKADAALKASQAALHQSQKLESIGKLTGGVAHDFNNVLQIISGNLQLLELASADQAPSARWLKTAAAAVDRGAKLSAQLLSFARRHPLKPAVINLAPLLQSLDELLRRALGATVDVELKTDPALWHTLVDPNQLENVLLNLAINARDAMDGRGHLTIELGNATLDEHYCARHQDVSAGQYVMLAVSDTGTGIPADLLDTIFEPFFTTKREGEGTGLGLSMAYGFIKQSGGHIKVYSEVGHGSTFKLYLPRSVEVPEQLVEALAGPVVGGSETVLVVEDDLPVQTTVVEMLRGLGYVVLKADDGQSALAIIASGASIDLLFTDVVMPGQLRSPELARRAKELLPELAILFTSGYTQNAITHGGRLDAGVELLSKPYRREDLARKLRELLNKQAIERLATRA